MKIAEATVARLVMYHRLLCRLKDEGQRVVSSNDIGEILGVKASQVRKDLSYFGEIGKRGVGYHVGRLYDHLEEILSTPGKWKMALVGVGHLGSALLGYKAFDTGKYSIEVLFDKDPQKIGSEMYGIPCYNIEEASTVIKEYGIQIIILAVPPGVAQECIDIVLQDIGVKGILNFSPTSIIVPENVLVYNVDISVELEKLLFYLKQTMINI